MSPVAGGAPAAGHVRDRRVRLFLPVTLAGFALFGLLVGTQGVLWAALMPALALSEGVFGSAQLVPPLAAVGLLLASGPLTGWAGPERLVPASLGCLAVSLLGLAAAAGLAGLVGALVVQGVAVGLLEIGLNGTVLDWEWATGRRAMNVMHAAFSGGAVAGGAGAGALLDHGLPYGAVLTGLAGVSLGLAAASVAARYPAAAGGRAGRRPRRALARRPALLVLTGVALLGIVGESVANTWSVIYLSERGASLVVGGAAFALFNAAMAAGRLANALVVTRLGPRGSLRASGVTLGLAGAALVLPGGVGTAVVGFVLLGVAVAGVVPTVLSAAAEAAPGDRGAVAGGVLAVAYCGFVLAPPVVGWLAELASLRLALVSVALSGVGILGLAGRVPRA